MAQQPGGKLSNQLRQCHGCNYPTGAANAQQPPINGDVLVGWLGSFSRTGPAEGLCCRGPQHTGQSAALAHGSDADVLAQMAQAARNHAAFDDEFAQASSSMQSVDNISLQETFMGIAESLSSAAGGLITAS